MPCAAATCRRATRPTTASGCEDELRQVVSSRPAAGAARVDAEGAHELKVEFLGRHTAPHERRTVPFEVIEMRSLRYGARGG